MAVYRLLHTPDYQTAFGSQPLHAEVMLLLNSYRYESNMDLTIFGLHLGLLGYLVYRSGYIPKVIGILLVIDGLGWLIDPLRPYLYSSSQAGSIFIQFFAIFSFTELILPLWLVIRGWKIQESQVRYADGYEKGPRLRETTGTEAKARLIELCSSHRQYPDLTRN
jgi:hypothetical protein